jgi:hypothetical protein
VPISRQFSCDCERFTLRGGRFRRPFELRHGEVNRVGVQLAVEQLQLENPTSTREVESVRQKLDDPAQDHDVVVAVSPSSPGGAGRCQEPLPFVEPKSLLAKAGQFRGHGDAVDTSVAVDLISHRIPEKGPENPLALPPYLEL